MAKREEVEQELVIDWRHICLSLLRKSWLIAVVGAVFALVAFIYTSFFVTPKYSSSVLLYVNNKSFSIGGSSVSISAADLSASQSLIDTYSAILKTRTTMEEVAEEAGLDYSYRTLDSMVSISKIEGTEIFRVTVTSADAKEAAHIANCISRVLPLRVEDIIDGSSMRIVDSAVVNPTKVSPNITTSVIQAFTIGILLCVMLIVLLAIIDDTIRSEDHLTRTYDIPILGRIPELNPDERASGKKSGYGYGYGSYGYGSYGYGHGHGHKS
ncbi:MAG: hypothetical protein IKC32_01560 [Clostridia bacterium]|nr:hypothetical protein [Clostridia bacterium]